MQNPNESATPGQGSENASPSPNTPITPMDMVLAKFQKWVEDMEKQQAEATKRAQAPSDIPRFVTRYR